MMKSHSFLSQNECIELIDAEIARMDLLSRRGGWEPQAVVIAMAGAVFACLNIAVSPKYGWDDAIFVSLALIMFADAIGFLVDPGGRRYFRAGAVRRMSEEELLRRMPYFIALTVRIYATLAGVIYFHDKFVDGSIIPPLIGYFFIPWTGCLFYIYVALFGKGFAHDPSGVGESPPSLMPFVAAERAIFIFFGLQLIIVVTYPLNPLYQSSFDFTKDELVVGCSIGFFILAIVYLFDIAFPANPKLSLITTKVDLLSGRISPYEARRRVSRICDPVSIGEIYDSNQSIKSWFINRKRRS